MSRPGIDNAVGMMDGAYFVGRKELLDFFNNLLHLNLAKIEETASGAVACQLIDYIFPGSVPMKRVNWQAKNDFEFVQNYKLLQSAFDKHRISKHIDVDRLIRAKYQDNLEFCQWLKAFFDQKAPEREDYDPVAVRSKGKGGKSMDCRKPKHPTSSIPKRPTSSYSTARKSVSSSTLISRKGSYPATSSFTTRSQTVASPAPKSTSTTPRKAYNKENNERSTHSSASGPSKRNSKPTMKHKTISTSFNSESVVADAKLMKENAELLAHKVELELHLDQAEKERDIYFEKLKKIQMLAQLVNEKFDQIGDSKEAYMAKNLVEDIFQVLYSHNDGDDVDEDDKESSRDSTDIDLHKNEMKLNAEEEKEINRKLEALTQGDLLSKVKLESLSPCEDSEKLNEMSIDKMPNTDEKYGFNFLKKEIQDGGNTNERYGFEFLKKELQDGGEDDFELMDESLLDEGDEI